MLADVRHSRPGLPVFCAGRLSRHRLGVSPILFECMENSQILTVTGWIELAETTCRKLCHAKTNFRTQKSDGPNAAAAPDNP